VVAALEDVRVLALLAPGVWHRRHDARNIGDGASTRSISCGFYYFYVEALSQGLTVSNPQYWILEARRQD
jgi:hypothetical protein